MLRSLYTSESVQTRYAVEDRDIRYWSGSNVIRGDLLLLKSHVYTKLFKKVLRSDDNTTFSVKEVGLLQVYGSGNVVSSLFGIATVLETMATMRTAFINKHTLQIGPSRHLVVSRKGISTRISASLSKNGAINLRNGQNQVCTVTSARAIPPHGQASIAMRTEWLEIYNIQLVECTTRKTGFFVAKTIVEVAPNLLSKVLVANMTN